MIYKIGNKIPKIDKDIFLADTSCVIGNVILKKGSSIWYGCTLRGDLGEIIVGEMSNIQEGTVIHGEDGFPVIIGDRVTIGHCCLIHGAIIHDDALIGMGSIITDGVVIPKKCFIYANSFITSKIGKIPEGSFIKGNPAKVVGKISEKQIEIMEDTYSYYYHEKDEYLNNIERIK